MSRAYLSGNALVDVLAEVLDVAVVDFVLLEHLFECLQILQELHVRELLLKKEIVFLEEIKTLTILVLTHSMHSSTRLKVDCLKIRMFNLSFIFKEVAPDTLQSTGVFLAEGVGTGAQSDEDLVRQTVQVGGTSLV